MNESGEVLVPPLPGGKRDKVFFIPTKATTDPIIPSVAEAEAAGEALAHLARLHGELSDKGLPYESAIAELADALDVEERSGHRFSLSWKKTHEVSSHTIDSEGNPQYPFKLTYKKIGSGRDKSAVPLSYSQNLKEGEDFDPEGKDNPALTINFADGKVSAIDYKWTNSRKEQVVAEIEAHAKAGGKPDDDEARKLDRKYEIDMKKSRGYLDDLLINKLKFLRHGENGLHSTDDPLSLTIQVDMGSQTEKRLPAIHIATMQRDRMPFGIKQATSDITYDPDTKSGGDLLIEATDSMFGLLHVADR